MDDVTNKFKTLTQMAEESILYTYKEEELTRLCEQMWINRKHFTIDEIDKLKYDLKSKNIL